jgi:hypothetical protein
MTDTIVTHDGPAGQSEISPNLPTTENKDGDAVLEWLQSLEDGTLFGCHDLAEIFEVDEKELWNCGVLEGFLEDYPKLVVKVREEKRADGLHISQLRSVAPRIEMGDKEKPQKINWRMWLDILEFHRARLVGERYGYTELAKAINANPKYLNTLRILDAINMEHLDTTKLINVVLPGGRKPTLMIEILRLE